MHGPLSGNRELLSFLEGMPPSGDGDPCALAVQADFDDRLPVGPAELDAFEAFLMPQILALLHGTPAHSPADTDSEAPRISAIGKRKPRTECRHEVPDQKS